MLKKAVVFSVFLGLPLILPACALAADGEKSAGLPKNLDLSTKKQGQANSETWGRALRGLVGGSEKECDGKSVDDFLKGKCNKLNGYDARPPEHKAPQPFKDSGGHSWNIYGEDGTTVIPPFFEFQNHKSRQAPAWGTDKFIKIEGFTQSGAPYQQVNPLLGIPSPSGDKSFPGFSIPVEPGGIQPGDKGKPGRE